MLKKLVVIGGIAALAGLGLGGVAMAQTNSAAPAAAAVAQGSVAGDVAAPAAPTTGTAEHGNRDKKEGSGRHHGHENRFEDAVHAQWVSKDAKTGTFVTHDAVRGDVSAVSSTSITIKAADGTSETFAVDAATKVHIKGANGAAHVKGAAKTPGSISQVKVGDQAGVLGTGTSTMTATQVMDRGVAAAQPSAPAAPAPATS